MLNIGTEPHGLENQLNIMMVLGIIKTFMTNDINKKKLQAWKEEVKHYKDIKSVFAVLGIFGLAILFWVLLLSEF